MTRVDATTSRACVAALDSAFTVDPTIKEIIYSDNGEGKYDDTSDEGDKDKDREDDGNDAIGSDEGSDVDKDEYFVAVLDIYNNEDDNDDFYKSSLFDDNDDNSIDKAKYRVPLIRGAGADRKPKSGRRDKPNTDGMSEKEKEEALGKWEKDWKRA